MLLQGHSTVPPVMLEPATPRSQVKHSTVGLLLLVILLFLLLLEIGVGGCYYCHCCSSSSSSSNTSFLLPLRCCSDLFSYRKCPGFGISFIIIIMSLYTI